MRPLALLLALSLALPAAAQQPASARPRRVFVSVDMEGIGGIGTGAMTTSGGKDYELGRRLMTEEVNAVVAAILRAGPARSTAATTAFTSSVMRRRPVA